MPMRVITDQTRRQTQQDCLVVLSHWVILCTRSKPAAGPIQSATGCRNLESLASFVGKCRHHHQQRTFDYAKVFSQDIPQAVDIISDILQNSKLE